MKITIDIDCTPQEARAFFGLPDVEPMQAALLAQLQERLAQSMGAMDPEVLVRTWLPGGMKGLAELQQQLWKQMMPDSGRKKKG
jgi:hypothetical protein